MKGKASKMFRPGQPVRFKTTERQDFSLEGRKSMVSYMETGTIKRVLPRSTRGGSAIILAATGRSVSRRLVNVKPVNVEPVSVGAAS